MKKLTITFFALMVAIMAMGGNISSQPNTYVKKGDANGDGKVTITDAVAIVSHIIGDDIDGFIPEAADVNGDNNITITDAVAIVDMILKGEADGLNVSIDNWENDGKDNGGVAE